MEFQTIEVDIAALCSVLHYCDGCRNESKRCCSSYEITVNKNELDNIVGCIPLAASFNPKLKMKRGYKNVFEKISRDLYSIDTDREDTCIFAYFEKHRILCSLHAVAEQFGIPFKKAKPASCLLWPLAISAGEKRVLSIQDDTFDFRCNIHSQFNNKFTKSLCPSISKIVEIVFGLEFKNELQEAVDEGLNYTKIQLRSSLYI